VPSECSVLSAQCNSGALTVCVFLFNVKNNTVLVLLVSSLLILLSILLYLLRCSRPVRLNVRLFCGYIGLFCGYREIMLFIGKPKGRSMMISNIYRAVLRIYRAVLRIYRALLRMYRAFKCTHCVCFLV